MSHHAVKQRLLMRLRALGGRLEEIGHALKARILRTGQGPAKDREDMATGREDDEVLEIPGQSGKAAPSAIRSALLRMVKGEYGLCARCGGEIAAERLAAVPHTPLCVSCAAG